MYDNSASNNTYENLPVPLASAPQHFTSSCTTSNLLSVPNQSSHSMPSTTSNHHTTLPRQSGAFMISSTLPSSGAHRTIPRTLTTSCSLRLRRELSPHHTVAPLSDVIAPSVSPQLLPRSAPPSMPHRLSRSEAFYEDVRLGLPPAPSAKAPEGKSKAQGAPRGRDFKVICLFSGTQKLMGVHNLYSCSHC